MTPLRAFGEVRIGREKGSISAEEMIAGAADCQGLLVTPGESITKGILDQLEHLTALSTFSVGFNHIDIAECTRRKIGVGNTPDVLTDATAELAMTLILAVARRVVEGDQMVRKQLWRGWEPMDFLGSPVTGKTLGIIGAGRIGMRTAQMACGFDMPIIYTSRHPKPDFERMCGAKRMALPELLQQSDFVSIHAPLTPETRHMIGRAQLAMMKPTAFLINTSRGPLVDEEALLEALKNNRIAGCGLDVYENEPRLTPGLAEMPNAVLLPHVGSATLKTRSKMAVMAAENLIAALSGVRPPHCVNPEVYS
jgi:glyoxylate reductase